MQILNQATTCRKLKNSFTKPSSWECIHRNEREDWRNLEYISYLRSKFLDGEKYLFVRKTTTRTRVLSLFLSLYSIKLDFLKQKAVQPDWNWVPSHPIWGSKNEKTSINLNRWRYSREKRIFYATWLLKGVVPRDLIWGKAGPEYPLRLYINLVHCKNLLIKNALADHPCIEADLQQY